MRGLDTRLTILVFAGTCPALSACAIPRPVRGEREFQVSFAAGSPDSAGHFIGGTEVRFLIGHDGNIIPLGFFAQAWPRQSGRRARRSISGVRFRPAPTFAHVLSRVA